MKTARCKLCGERCEVIFYHRPPRLAMHRGVQGPCEGSEIAAVAAVVDEDREAIIETVRDMTATGDGRLPRHRDRKKELVKVEPEPASDLEFWWQKH